MSKKQFTVTQLTSHRHGERSLLFKIYFVIVVYDCDCERLLETNLSLAARSVLCVEVVFSLLDKFDDIRSKFLTVTVSLDGFG